MREHTIIRAGGIALIAGATAFLGVFSFLAARFDYPAVLDGSAAQVLPKLLATGATGRAVWALYGFLPLVWIPAGVGSFHALRRVREGSTRTGMLFALIAAVSMMLGFCGGPAFTGRWRRPTPERVRPSGRRSPPCSPASTVTSATTSASSSGS